MFFWCYSSLYSLFSCKINKVNVTLRSLFVSEILWGRGGAVFICCTQAGPPGAGFALLSEWWATWWCARRRGTYCQVLSLEFKLWTYIKSYITFWSLSLCLFKKFNYWSRKTISGFPQVWGKNSPRSGKSQGVLFWFREYWYVEERVGEIEIM